MFKAYKTQFSSRDFPAKFVYVSRAEHASSMMCNRSLETIYSGVLIEIEFEM